MNIGQNNNKERRQNEQLARRKAIIKAAREVFFAKGFMNATIDDIADRCSLAKGTIYLYFKSKEELYMSVMAEGMQRLRKTFWSIRDLDPDQGCLVEQAFITYLGFYKKNKKYFRIMFLSSQPDLRSRVPEDVLRNCMEAGSECLGIVRDLIQKGIDRGLYRKVDSWAVANILWATVNGIIMAYEQDPVYREEIVGIELEQMLLQGLDLAMGGLKVTK